MKSYLITMMAVALLNGMLGMIAPDGNTKKYVRLLGTLCLLCAMVQPILGLGAEGEGLFQKLWDLSVEETLPNYGEIYNQALLSGGKENLENILKSRIAEAYSLSLDSFDVAVELAMKNNETTVRQVKLTLRETAVLVDPRELSDHINEWLGCPCVVIYE